jgi:uncharacterized protein (TIGR03437 family)
MRPRRWFAVLCLLAALCQVTPRADCQSTPGPVYTADSLASSAANVAGYYALNSFLTIYGQNLAYVTRTITAADIRNGQLPIALAGTEVEVFINQLPADVYYVSPGQVNVLIPPTVLSMTGPATVLLENQGRYGPSISITLATAAPVLFQSDASTVVATHGNGPLVTPQAPAQAGEVVVLYATGLGPTEPAVVAHEIPVAAASIVDRADFQVVLNGVPVDPRLVLYAGVTPGFAGLYQINMYLPADCPPNPEVRIGFGGSLSPAGRILPVQ